MEQFPSSGRYLVIGIASVLTTLALFLLMQALISMELANAPIDVLPSLSAPLLPNIETRQPELRKRALRIVPTEIPPSPEGVPIPPSDVTALVKAEKLTLGSIAELEDHGAIDLELYPPVQDLMPIYVVQPAYPFRAVLREIQGFVLVNFNVRANGTVQNPVVVESEPGDLFDDAALSAVVKFKFQPRMVGGDALAVNNVQLRFVFRLEADGSPSADVDGDLVFEDDR